MLYLSTILLSVFITASLIPIIIKLADKYHMVDFPNPRKVHTIPIPRIGGLAMALGAAVPIVLWAATDAFVMAYLAGAGILVLFGLVDDMKGIGYKAKFTGQIIAALVVVFCGGLRINSLGTLLPDAMLLPEWFAIALSIIAVVGVTNAINLSDGLDGLAGGISLLCFCCIGYLAYLEGNRSVVLLSLALAGAIFGFLRFNTHPASLFMGDTGSMFLGFTLALISIEGSYKGSTFFAIFVPIIAMGLPFVDTGLSILRRVLSGKKIFTADKEHVHHKLLLVEGHQKKVVLTLYMLTISFGLIAVALIGMQGIWAFSAVVITVGMTISWAKSFGLLDFFNKKPQNEKK